MQLFQIGQFALASGRAAVAIGRGARAVHADTVVLGTGAASERAGEVVLGTATQSVRAPGIPTAEAAGRQQGDTFLVTSDAAGRLATTDFSLSALDRRLDGMEEASHQGTALAMSMAAITFLPQGRNFGATSNVAHYEGETAVGLSLAGRLHSDANHALFLTGSAGLGLGEGTVGGRVGLSITW